MKYRSLASTNILVSEIGFPLQGLTIDDEFVGREDDAIRLLQESYEAGVVLFDAADVDHSGYTEELLAKALGSHRHDIVAATKVGYDFYTPNILTEQKGPLQNFDPAYLRLACERSLRRLGTDYIDIYQLHHPPVAALERDELWFLLEALVREGKVRSLGLVFGSDIDLIDVGAALEGKPIDGFQLPYVIDGNSLEIPGCELTSSTIVCDYRLDRLVKDVSQDVSSAAVAGVGTEVDINGNPRRNLQDMFALVEHHGEQDQASLILTVLLLDGSVCSVTPWVKNLEDLTRASVSIEAVLQCEQCHHWAGLLK